MKTTAKKTPQFVICVRSDNADLLTPRKIYELLPDETAAKTGYVRIRDNEGEDYLYPAKWFIAVEFTPAIQRSILRASAAA